MVPRFRLCSTFAFLLVLGGVIPPGSALAFSFSAVADFSTTTNSDASTWSYRGQTGSLVRDGAYDLLTVFGNPQNPWPPDHKFWSDGLFHAPAVGVNQTGSPLLLFGGNVQWPDATIWMNPLNNSLTVVSWLSPSAMDLTIDF